jgi:hypothetical protein
MKLSNSSLNKYLSCPRSYKLHYREKIVSKFKGSALFFGGAVDLALNELLEKKGLDKAKEVFVSSWSTGYDNANRPIVLKDHPYVTYSDADFDFDMLTKSDLSEIQDYRVNHQINVPDSIFDFIKFIKENKRNDTFKQLDPIILGFYNMINWLCLRNKGLLMIEAYNNQILPEFKEVLAIQVQAKLDSNCGDTVEGIVDLVVRLHDDTVVLLDNKTSSVDYGPDSVRTSQQLTLYKLVLNDMHSKGLFPHKIDKCGYAVIKKRPTKIVDKVCKSCGHKATGSHKTCNNTIDEKRCGGEWDGTINYVFETQFLLDNISENQEDLVLETINEVNKAISHEIFTPNLNSCIGVYGKCVYYSLCHSKNETEYFKIEEKSNEQK